MRPTHTCHIKDLHFVAKMKHANRLWARVNKAWRFQNAECACYRPLPVQWDRNKANGFVCIDERFDSLTHTTKTKTYWIWFFFFSFLQLKLLIAHVIRCKQQCLYAKMDVINELCDTVPLTHYVIRSEWWTTQINQIVRQTVHCLDLCVRIGCCCFILQSFVVVKYCEQIRLQGKQNGTF